MKLPCPRCGAIAVVETFCAACLRQLYPLVKSVKTTKLTVCAKSGHVKTSRWENIPLTAAIDRTITKALVIDPEAKISKVECTPDLAALQELITKPGIHRTITVPVLVQGKRGAGKTYEEEYEIPLELETTISPLHAKAGTGYFEATLQARNERAEQYRALHELAAKHAAAGFAITKEIPTETGHDYLLTSNKTARKIAEELHGRFGGSLDTNAKLFSHDKQRSRDLFRVTFRLEYPAYAVGDVVTDGTRALRIKSLGKSTKFEDLTTGKAKDEKYDPARFQKVELRETEVVRERPRLAVLDPETYQEIVVENASAIAAGARVLIAKVGGRAWIVREKKNTGS